METLIKLSQSNDFRGSNYCKSLRENDLHNLEPEDLCAITVEAAAMARVPLAGTS